MTARYIDLHKKTEVDFKQIIQISESKYGLFTALYLTVVRTYP